MPGYYTDQFIARIASDHRASSLHYTYHLAPLTDEHHAA